MLNTERLKELFDYCPSGRLIRRVASSNRSKVGEAIGFYDRLGYRKASVDDKTYPLHRLVWLWHGKEPCAVLDHINRVRDDNRIENLRPATRCENMQNRGMPISNTSGAKNVYWRKDRKAWRVVIQVNGKKRTIGLFKDFELAELVAAEACDKYHGAFAHAN